MNKLILLSILMIMVYSWEEFKQTLRAISYALTRKKYLAKNQFTHLDKFVGALVMIATIPISLTYYLNSSEELTKILWLLAAQLLIISLAANGITLFVRRIQTLYFAKGAEKLGVVAFSLLGLVTPGFQTFTSLDRLEKNILAKFTFFLCLPPLLGLTLKYTADSASNEIFLPNLDLLIQVLVAGLFINITIRFLEDHFRFYRLEKLSAYARVLLGGTIKTTPTVGVVFL